MYRRFGAEVTVVEMGPRLIGARGRGRFGGDPRDPGGRGHRRPHSTPSASASRRTPTAIARRRRLHDGRAGGRRLATCCSRSGRRPNTDDLGLDKAGVATDARGYIKVDDQLAHQRPRHLGAGRLQRPRRLHPHRLQRFRDRRRQPARRRAAPGQRPHPGLRALHRSAARPRRHDRGARRASGPAAAGRQAADDPRRPRHREGRDAGLHEGRRRRRDARRSSAPRSSAPAATRRSTAFST